MISHLGIICCNLSLILNWIRLVEQSAKTGFDNCCFANKYAPIPCSWRLMLLRLLSAADSEGVHM